MRSPRLITLCLVFLGGFVSAQDTGNSTWTSRAGYFQLDVQSDLNPVVINKMHRWSLRLVDAEGDPITGAAISVKGGMPAHDHGLPTAPRVTSEPEAGNYVLEGLRFHMRGQWELEFTIRAGETSDVVIVAIKL